MKTTLLALLLALSALGDANTHLIPSPSPALDAIPASQMPWRTNTLHPATNAQNSVPAAKLPPLQSTPQTIAQPTFADGVRIAAVLARRNPDVFDLNVLFQMTYQVWKMEQAQK